MATIILTCFKCGSEDFYYEKTYDLVENYHYSLSCEKHCDNTEDGIAAEYDKTDVTSYTDSENGAYDETGEWLGLGEESEKIDTESEIENHQVYCQDCFDGARDQDWEEELVDEATEENVEEKTRCPKCGREFDLQEALQRNPSH